MERKRRHKSTIRSVVLTLRLTQEEMLRFKVAALCLGRKRARLVRERVADLIGWVTVEKAVVSANVSGAVPEEVVRMTGENGLQKCRAGECISVEKVPATVGRQMEVV